MKTWDNWPLCIYYQPWHECFSINRTTPDTSEESLSWITLDLPRELAMCSSSSDWLAFSPTPTTIIVMPASWTFWAAVVVSVGIFEYPSVRRIPIFGIPSFADLAPFDSKNPLSRIMFNARLVNVEPAGISEIPFTAELISDFVKNRFSLNTIVASSLNRINPMRSWFGPGPTFKESISVVVKCFICSKSDPVMLTEVSKRNTMSAPVHFLLVPVFAMKRIKRSRKMLQALGG